MTEETISLPSTAERAYRGRRAVPRPGDPASDRWTVPGGGTTVAVGPRESVARTAGASRRPVHVLVAVGMTAGMYAASLAGVAALQATSDAQVAAERAPAEDAIARLRASHASLESRLAQLDGAFATAADEYKVVADGIAAHEKALAKLGKQVKSDAGSAAALSVSAAPAARLPGVSRTTVYVSSKPAVNACTTASGKPC